MTKLLERAITKLRSFPEPDQDEAAERLEAFMREAEALRSGRYDLDEDERAAIRESKAQAERGEFVSDEAMEAFWNRRGR
ncbi:MAG TPA: hypothetical protein VF601_03855 [Beijerinckiaceae bacterium]|jgi:predicted transcriptional regulator